MESQDILSTEDKVNGRVEPDLNSFNLQGLDDVYMDEEKQFILSASPKVKTRYQESMLGGRWTCTTQYGIEGAVVVPVEVTRVGLDSATFKYKFTLEGKYKLHIAVSSIPIKGSPFTVDVHWGSQSQLNKWKTIETFLDRDHSAITRQSLTASLDIFNKKVHDMDYTSLDYRRHILSRVGGLQPDDRKTIEQEVSRCIVLKKFGSILDDVPEMEGIFISHNSWMEWPTKSGYQAKVVERLAEKEKKALLEKSASFGKNNTYGSTMIFPVTNVAGKGQGVCPKQLVNTVTVVFKSGGRTSQPYKHTKYSDLEQALSLGFREANKKGIKNMAIPANVSGNYFSGGKIEESVLKIITDWVKAHPGTSLETLTLVHKDQTPKALRKKKSLLGRK